MFDDSIDAVTRNKYDRGDYSKQEYQDEESTKNLGADFYLELSFGSISHKQSKIKLNIPQSRQM
jgi:hypothetical protein